MTLKEAIESLRNGKPVLVHDSDERENEVDIFIRASSVTHDLVRLMRKDGGGLICLAVHPEIADKLGLPFMEDLLVESDSEVLKRLVPERLPYDKRSSFSITVNHRDTITGITDIDRALTIRSFGEMCKEYWENKNLDIREKFVREFRAPGHVHLLRGAKKLLSEREGHTELAIALALLSDIEPCIVLVEMLGDNGKALSVDAARKYAEEKGFVILEGKIIKEAFEENFGGH